MYTYIALLRGINVGGKNILKMQDLNSLFVTLQYSAVQTYLQSGNVVFKSEESNDFTLRLILEEAIIKMFHMEVKVILRKSIDIQHTLMNNPFLPEFAQETQKLYVTFLEKTPNPELTLKLNNKPSFADPFRIIDRNIYICCENGYGNTKMNNSFFEKALQVTATTRNWNTIKELSSMTLSDK